MTRRLPDLHWLFLAALLLHFPAQASAAFTAASSGGTLTLTQTVDNGAVLIDNNGAGTSFRVIEGGVTTFSAANSLVVVMLDNSDQSLIIDLDNPLARDLTLELGHGTRLVDLSGTNNEIGGHLKIKAGDGNQTVELSVNAALVVNGRMTINLGQGNDVVDEDDRDLTVTGDLLFKGVNMFTSGGSVLVAGDVSVFVNNENLASTFNDNGGMTILGHFKYVGGDEVDNVFLDSSAVIGCGVNVDLGRGITSGGDDQDFSLAFGGTVGGDVTVRSGTSTNGTTFTTDGTTRIGGNLVVNCGKGFNFIELSGRCGGSLVKYVGGNAVDIVILGLRARGAKVKVDLNKGGDTFTLSAGATVRKVTADFGAGIDTFNNNLGAPAPFKIKLVNLP